MLTIRQSLSAAAAASLALCACARDDNQQNQAANAANAVQQQTVPLPVPSFQAPLDRGQLLVDVLRAATDFASGVDDQQRQKDLADKKFEFRFRFGCNGPDKADSGKDFGWTFNDKTRALKVRATPALSTKNAAVEAIAGEAFEAVEGFWVAQPWLLSAVCPAIEKDQAQAATPAKQSDSGQSDGKTAETGKTKPSASADNAKPSADAAAQAAATQPRIVGIAQFFTATGPRTMRRSGRPYEATKRLEAGDKPSGGFDFVLSGRLAPLPDGRVIACTKSTGGARPSCIISVEFGKVWIERADTKEQIAQWGSG